MKKLLLIYSLLFVSLGFSQEDLTVAQAIEKALENNYQIKLVKSNYEVSQVQNSWGMAGMVPTFGINLNNMTNISDNTNNPASFFPGVVLNDNFQATLDMTWTVFSGFGIRINKERFEQLEEQTKGNAIVVIENTVYDVIIAYYTAVTQERKLDIFKDMLSFSNEKLDYFKLKNEIGTNTSIDLLEFKNQVLTDSTNFLLQRLSFVNAKRNLNLVMAEDIEASYRLIDKLEFEIPEANYGQLQDQMLSNNQNLKNQFINYELQELNTQAQKSAYYPVVTVGLGATPSVGYFQLFGDNAFSANTNSLQYYGTISARYTLFDGWKRKRNVQISEIQRDMAEMQIEDLKLNLSHQLRGVFELYQTQNMVEDMALEKIGHSKQLWDLGVDQYDLGLINIFNLNDIKLSYESAMLNYYDRLFDLLKTHYDLMRITGGISQEYKIESSLDE